MIFTGMVAAGYIERPASAMAEAGLLLHVAAEREGFTLFDLTGNEYHASL
ncbi:MAG: hypothetical protein LBD27_05855 [Tannerella sp.]|nr:hypothetical protein [Tannerella sp.]